MLSDSHLTLLTLWTVTASEPTVTNLCSSMNLVSTNSCTHALIVYDLLSVTVLLFELEPVLLGL
jgi:hypothetical protein